MEKLVIKGIKELAEVLDVSVQTAYNLTKRPDFPSARLGKLVVTPVDELKKWLANGGTEQRSA